MDSTVRHPAVAGRFYPRDRETLQKDLQSYLPTQAIADPGSRMRRPARWLHLLRRGSWSSLRHAGLAPTHYRALPQPYRQRTPACDHEQRRLGNSTGPGSNRFDSG